MTDEELRRLAEELAERVTSNILRLENVTLQEGGCEHTSDDDDGTCWHCREERYERVVLSAAPPFLRRVAEEARRRAEAENEALRADLSLAMSYYICDNRLGPDYCGADEDFALKLGGKINAEMERWKRTLGLGEYHRKHPTGDHCVFCKSQWPCEFAPEEGI